MILSSNTDTGKFFEQTGYRHKNSQRFYSKWFCSSNLTLLFLYFVVTCNVKTFSFRGQHHFHLSTARSSGILMKSMKSNVAFSRGSSIFLSPLLSSTFSHGSTISTLRTFRGMFRSSSSSEKKRSLERYRDFNIFQAAREADDPANRPFTLPPGEFKPKQSLGQNFLVDQNYVRKIVDSLEVLRPPSSLLFSSDTSDVIEIGPGIGALTKQLFPKYPAMTVVEIDQRAVKFLREKIPMLSIIEDDVLNVDWTELANKRGKKLHVIGNLPYYIVSQVLFALADHNTAIR